MHSSPKKTKTRITILYFFHLPNNMFLPSFCLKEYEKAFLSTLYLSSHHVLGMTVDYLFVMKTAFKHTAMVKITHNGLIRNQTFTFISCPMNVI